jgi:hypothetical protein
LVDWLINYLINYNQTQHHVGRLALKPPSVQNERVSKNRFARKPKNQHLNFSYPSDMGARAWRLEDKPPYEVGVIFYSMLSHILSLLFFNV